MQHGQLARTVPTREHRKIGSGLEHSAEHVGCVVWLDLQFKDCTQPGEVHEH
jgi:hypothetical protein